jgi:hypothetical protein
MTSSSPRAIDLAALAVKYDQLMRLRAQRDECERQGQTSLPQPEAHERRAQMSKLSAQFPGSLRELELDLQTLTQRYQAALEHAAPTGSPAPLWLELAHAFHARVLKARAIKGWLASHGKTVSPGDLVSPFAAWYVTKWPCLDVDDWLDVITVHRHPPEGRLMNIVWRDLENQFGQPKCDLCTTLFGQRATKADDE